MTARLDRELVERGLARSRGQALDAIRDGRVLVNGQVATKGANPTGPDDVIDVFRGDHYVSRAAHKLAGALAGAAVTVPARVLDAGASTGGFTQVLLEAGAQVVYAVDVGHGQLAPELRTDPRVVVHERLNLRDLTLDHTDGESVDLVVGDVSFISLRMLLEPMFGVLSPTGSALLLVKPQFEVGRKGLDSRGVVRDEGRRIRAVAEVAAVAATLGRRVAWQGESGLAGESGNVEYFLHLVPGHA
ncbi:MAG TPA: TlyA family RNA methyltransferase [Propionicimonas sp.]|uniref:TlyA family RNA methyltransferase n=1 Tax=Propionicimonas sp. TaxID=1955623 RepID=UPI002F40D5A4